MSNEPVLPSDLDIITAARQHVQENRQRPLGSGFYQSGFPLLQNGEPVAWIKTGDDSVADEAATQKHVYESFMQEPSLSNGVRVPKIYRVILCDDYPWTIIVMEYVSGRTVQQWLEISNKMEDLLFSRILEAMKVLLSLPPPQRNTPPGPAGGGRIDHLVFGSLYCEIGSAPRDFDSVQDLQNHMNQIVDERYGVADFVNEDFRLCHCDPNQRNFILTDGEGGGPIYILDFGECMWLPVSFLKWALVANPRDAIFPYLEENLEQLRPPFCLAAHQRVLSRYNYEINRRSRTGRS